MEASTFTLITDLCLELLGGEIPYHDINRKSIIRRLRSEAFKIVLTSRNNHVVDESEENPKFLLGSVLEYAYSKAKEKGDWSKDVCGDVCHTIDSAESLVEGNPSLTSVLKFLLCLANTSPDEEAHEKDSHSMNMKISITDHSFKHKPLIVPNSSFNPKIFEVSVKETSKQFQGLLSMDKAPGTGLKHQAFFVPIKSSSCIDSKIFEDVNNGNWFNSRPLNVNFPVINSLNDSRYSIHQDEGYVTPDQDLVQDQHHSYVPWEDISEEDLHFVYGWKEFGFAVESKEPLFALQDRNSANALSRLIHTSRVKSCKISKSDAKPLKIISLQELEVAFKNLLVGVESSIFHYDKIRCSFVLQKGLCLRGTTPNTLEEYCEDFIVCGNNFKQLSKISDTPRKSELFFQMLCKNIREYLQCYRGVVLNMPLSHSLLETRHWLHKLSSQMQFLISLCPLKDGRKTKDLLIYLCDKMPVHLQHDISFVYYYVLQSCFGVYFKFLSKWLFEGITDSRWENEFFIKCNPLTEEMYNGKYWAEGFTLDHDLVPNCLRGLESKLLLCGKSMALLKLCANDDPLCKQVKSQSPEIICCFNMADLTTVEKTIESYKENCKARCQQLYGNTSPEFHNEEYYAERMAKTLDTIKERQEEERRLMAEKKHVQFNMLKREMEDAKERKIQEKINTIEEEKRLIEEAKNIDEINDLRRLEEREKIMQFYSSLSDAADRRRDRAEWKIKRLELDNKRRAFFKEQNESLEKSVTAKKENSKNDNEMEVSLSEKSLEKYLKTYGPVQGSGDYSSVVEASLQETSNTTAIELNKEQAMKDDGEHNNMECDEADFHQSQNQNQASDDKREWLIALDVADQARQSALRFKQRNMHNDYNIITGEESTFERKFGVKDFEECPVNTVITDIVESNKGRGDQLQTESDAPASGNDADKSIEVLIEDKQSVSPESSVQNFEISVSKLSHSLKSPCKSSDSSCDFRIEVIDMTSIYQNVQRSVIIPLKAQLELTSDAILRLYDKHNLLRHIECIWKHFFLLDGEFARNLTTNLFRETQKAQHPSYLLNVMKLNSLLRCAVGTSVDEQYTERLSFFVKQIPTVFRMIDPEMLACLSLRYKTCWPINIIITDEIILKKDLIFKHLLKLHRVSWALEETTYLLKNKKLSCSKQYRKVQLYRHIMSHFVTALKHYLTAMVIEKMWNEFKKKFQAAKNVDMMIDVYRSYVRSVNSKCLLGKAKVHTEQLLNNLFKEVLIFYESLRSGEWIEGTSSGDLQHSNFSRVNHAFVNFKKLADHLVYLFKKMSGAFPDIEQLVTALTLNGFYAIKER